MNPHREAISTSVKLYYFRTPASHGTLLVMSNQLARIVEAFNAGRIDEVVARTTDDYHYSDPLSGRFDGAQAHEALMRQVLTRFPDRNIELFKSWSAPNAEFGEGVEGHTGGRRRRRRNAIRHLA